jgi:ribokinase
MGRREWNMFDLIALGAVFLDQEFRFMGAVKQGDKRIVELAFHEEVRGKDLFLTPGGSAVNTAVQAARLGMKTRVQGKVGADPFGDLILAELEKESVDVQSLIRSKRDGTGVTVILSGRRALELDTAMITYNGANEILEATELAHLEERRDEHRKRGVFFVGDFFSLPRLQSGMADLLANARRKGWVTVLDHGRFRRSKTPDRVLRDLDVAMERVDVYLPSEREIRELTRREDLGDALNEVQERYGVHWIAVKRGPEGCRLRSRDVDLDVPAFRIREGGVSALGAGSAFNAAFVRQWLQDPDDLLLAGRLANAAGRLKIMSGTPPTRARLQSFLEKETRKQAAP